MTTFKYLLLAVLAALMAYRFIYQPKLQSPGRQWTANANIQRGPGVKLGQTTMNPGEDSTAHNSEYGVVVKFAAGSPRGDQQPLPVRVQLRDPVLALILPDSAHYPVIEKTKNSN